MIMSLTMLSQGLFSQSQMETLYQAGICDEEGYCIPSLQGLPRSKGFSLNYTTIRNQNINTKYAEERFSGVVKEISIIDVKAKVPILLKDNLKIILGADYSTYDFKFAERDADRNAVYRTLNRVNYNTLGVKLYVLKPLKGNKYIFSRFSAQLSGDLSKEGIEDYFRYTFSILYGIRSSTNMTWGVGLNYRFALDRHLVFPTLTYSQILSRKWSLEAYLPVNVNLRYMPNSKNIFELRNRLGGEHFNVNSGISGNNNIFLDKTDFYSTIAYEREVHDFLWVSLAAGRQFNIGFDSSINKTAPGNDSFRVSNNLSNTFLFEVGIFIVPPKKWFN
jgi:hypothetical protein